MPVIAVSAEVNADIERQAITAGANEVVAKPIEPQALRALAIRWTGATGKAGAA